MQVMLAIPFNPVILTRMLESATGNETPDYHGNSFVEGLNSIFRSLRVFHSENIAYFFSPERRRHVEYVYGVVIILSLLAFIAFTWGVILIVLKYRERQFGCAAGKPFSTSLEGSVRTQSSIGIKTESVEHGSSLDSSSNSGSAHSGEIVGEIFQPSLSETNRKNNSCLQSSVESQSRPSFNDSTSPEHACGMVTDEDRSLASEARSDCLHSQNSLSIANGFQDNDSLLDSTRNDDSGFEDPSKQRSVLDMNIRRAKRTRFAFLSFGVAAILCIVFFLVFSFARVQESIHTFERSLVSTQDTLDQVNASLQSVDSAGHYAIEIFSSTNFNATTLCPGLARGDNSLDIDLEEFIAQAYDDFAILHEIIENNLMTYMHAVDTVQEIKDTVENDIEYTQRYLWIVPGVLLGVAIMTTIGMLGVILAWREKSGKRFQSFMSFVALPVLIALCLICWIFTMAAAAAAVASGDACTAGGAEGGPDTTVVKILEEVQLYGNGTTYKMIYAYTNPCLGVSPTPELVDLEASLQDIVNSVWIRVSTIDSISRENITMFCGNESSSGFNNFVEGTRHLAKSLSTIRNAFDSTVTSLHCENIHPIYVNAIHDGLCTNAASGFGIGFILLFCLSICMMVLISLRAAWLHEGGSKKVDERVYDEHEVAENMVLDEYEEYLAYISRYKHEWEDYEGINNAIEEGEVVRACAQASDPEMTCLESNDSSLHLDGDVCDSEYESSVAESSLPDDISFPSLQITESITDSATGILVVPYLLPRSNSEEEEDHEVFEIISPRAKPDLAIPSSIHTMAMRHDSDIDHGEYMKWPSSNSILQGDYHGSKALPVVHSQGDDMVSIENVQRHDNSHEDQLEACTLSSRHYPRSSQDVDSIAEKIMKSFEAPTEVDDDDNLETMYGVILRSNDESNESNFEHQRLPREMTHSTNQSSLSREQPESRYPIQEDDCTHTSRGCSDYSMSPRHKIAGKMNDMVTKFNRFG